MPIDLTTPTTSSFHGFDIPRQNWFKMPNNWTDITAEISSIAELKVVEYVLKHTWGYQEYGLRKRITNDEFMHGRKRKDGTRIDKGTGLTKPSVIAGLKAAIERGLLIEEIDDSDLGRVKKYYSLRMQEGLSEEIEAADETPPTLPDAERGNELGVKTFYPRVKDLNAGVKKIDPEVKNFDHRGKKSLPRTEKDTLARHLEQEDNNNNSNAERNEQNVVVVALVQQGITDKVAQQLASRYSPERIAEKIEFLSYLGEYDPEKVKNPQGWLRTAIEQDYAAPDGYKSPAERLAEAAAEERRAAEMQEALVRQQRRQAEVQERQHQAQEEKLTQLQAQYGTGQRELVLWKQVLAELRISMPSAAFQAYMANTVLLTLTNAEALIGLANASARDWVENRLTKQIQRILASYLGGQKVTVKFISLPDAG